MLSHVQSTHVQYHCPINCFTITDDGSLKVGALLRHYGTIVSTEKKLSPDKPIDTAEVTKQNGALAFTVTSPQSGTIFPYFLVAVSTGLTSRRARQLKRGDPARRVTNGIVGEAETLVIQEWRTLVLVRDDQIFTALYPDGTAQAFQRKGSFLTQYALTPQEKLAIRLVHAETLLSTEDSAKRSNVHVGLIKLLRLQTDPELAQVVLDFMRRQDVGAKIETKMKATLPTIAHTAEHDPDDAPKLRVIKKERKGSPRNSMKKIALYTAHRQSFAANRSSFRT